jgi:hypothetical protein
VSVDSVNTIMSYWYKCYTFCDCWYSLWSNSALNCWLDAGCR